jgi:Response regulators consisting of a CheY-like receiver domain and a winged-helix DNA-binding domain
MMEKDRIKVLLAEDEQTLAMIIKDTLDEEGFAVTLAENGNEGLKCFFESKPDIVVADVMMPQLDGFEMVSKIRQTDKEVPILFLTARSAVKDVVEGFELGANDYLKKPFNMQELIVRIKALVGRIRMKTEKKNNTDFYVGDYMFNAVSQQLYYAGNQEELSHRESEILKRLCMNKDEVVETRTILLDLWGDDNFFNTKSLHVFITKLRRKLAKDERIKIINVRGIGYKLIV